MKKKIILKVVAVIVVLGVVIQLVPLPLRGNNPAVTSEPKWDSPQTRALMKRACFDCHSNETAWPWYSYVAPVSWLVYNDVSEGRSRMNLSDWTSRRQPDLDEIIGEIQGGGMPPAIYLPMHPNARLTDAEKQQLVDGLTQTLR
jgi:hypothetical protein